MSRTKPQTVIGCLRRAGLVRLVALLAAAALVGTACGGSSSSSSKGGAPITVGLLTTLTGPAAGNFDGNLQGAQARFDLQNARGGVNGHRINLVSADDQTSFQGASNAMSLLIQQRHVFAIIDLSDFTSVAYRIAQAASVPVVGFPTDGPEWGQQPNTNMVSILGNVPPNGIAGIVNTAVPNVAKLEGAKNMAALAIDNEQPSVLGAQSFIKASKAVGLKVGYENFTIPIGTTNVDPVVLGMKQAHVDGFNSGLLDNTNFALLTSAHQQGLHLVAPILASGYGQHLLDQPGAVQAAQGAIFQVFQRPVDIPNSATKTEQSAFATYEHFTGVPTIGWTSGWLSADLIIQGLQRAGANPTRTTFLNALHNLKGYDAEGLLPAPIDTSLAGFGKPPATVCYYFTKLQGSRFVTINGGKPICGKNIA